jgi:hypothetical protein
MNSEMVYELQSAPPMNSKMVYELQSGPFEFEIGL